MEFPFQSIDYPQCSVVSIGFKPLLLDSTRVFLINHHNIDLFDNPVKEIYFILWSDMLLGNTLCLSIIGIYIMLS